MSKECMDLALDWIQSCASTHIRCAMESYGIRPSRLIEIDGGDLHLCDFRNIGVDDLRYCALSYCWGTSKLLKTTTENISDHHLGIPMHDLPETVKDAILVTRKLGVKYLWVDSLCILQDSALDWAEECSKMGGYYQSAYVVLSALDSGGALEGFLRPRPEKNLTFSSARGELRIRAQPPARKQVFKNAPLNRRGWAFQERLLSTRILHFSRSELFWECQTLTAREGSLGTASCEVNSGLIVDSDGDDLKASLCNTGTDPFAVEDGAFALWYRIVKLYSRKTLTHSSDKMAAITGIAAKIAEKENAQYRLGLWEQDIHGLTWSKADTAKRLEAFPSWSWLSWDGPVNYQIYSEPRMQSENEAKVVDMSLEKGLEARDSHLVVGALSRTVFFLGPEKQEALARRYLIQESVSIYHSDSYRRYVNYGSNFSTHVYDHQQELLGMASLDFPKEGDTTCTAICIGERFSDQNESTKATVDVVTYFLLIQPDIEAKHHWKRMGLGVTREFRAASKIQISKMFGDSQRKRFCLV